MFAELLLLAWLSTAATPAKPVIVLHGGAGTIDRAEMTAEREAAYRMALESAIRKGYRILDHGGSSVDAAVAAIVLLEDSPLFNAGRGAVFNAEGEHEFDASLMRGSDRKAGAVAAVQGLRNPILGALAVLRASPHVLLMGKGAESFAREHNLRFEASSYFFTERRARDLERAKRRDSDGTDLGTVGVVALDRHGMLAAGTSTGGLTNKRFGRVGDSPIIGAGNYADEHCGVSGTGQGEYFIRSVTAFRLCARVGAGAGIDEAAQAAIADLVALGGSGGVIAMDHEGHYAFAFSTSGMYRAAIGRDGKLTVAIYRD